MTSTELNKMEKLVQENVTLRGKLIAMTHQLVQMDKTLEAQGESIIAHPHGNILMVERTDINIYTSYGRQVTDEMVTELLKKVRPFIALSSEQDQYDPLGLKIRAVLGVFRTKL